MLTEGMVWLTPIFTKAKERIFSRKQIVLVVPNYALCSNGIGVIIQVKGQVMVKSIDLPFIYKKTTPYFEGIHNTNYFKK